MLRHKMLRHKMLRHKMLRHKMLRRKMLRRKMLRHKMPRTHSSNHQSPHDQLMQDTIHPELPLDEHEATHASALATGCCVMSVLISCICVCGALLDRMGFATSAFVVLGVGSFPIAFSMFSSAGKSLVENGWRSVPKRWILAGVWTVYSFFMLLSAQRFLFVGQ